MSAGRTTSPPSAAKRLMLELQQLAKDPNPDLVRVGPATEGELTRWEAVMQGPRGTAYEHGRWKLDVRVPDNYPLAPPVVSFVTRVCHANVHFQTGEICLDLLKDSWTPAYTISQTLSAIHQLLSYPEPDSPLNVDLAVLLRNGDLIGAESLVRWCCDTWRWDGD